MKPRWAAAALAVAALQAFAQAADPTALPLGAERVAASAEECAVWRRERGFARSVEAHDASAFESHLHPGTVFNAGAARADRGRERVLRSWAGIVEGKSLVLRWRPGVVNIGGEANIALSRGPFILQTTQGGAAVFEVGLYQTVWVRESKEAAWRVLFDGSASAPTRVADRAEAERWVVAQAMSECAEK